MPYDYEENHQGADECDDDLEDEIDEETDSVNKFEHCFPAEYDNHFLS